MAPYFNYVVPIFNKEDILPGTLDGMDRCASPDAQIFTVIDGCTDRSEQVVDDFASRTGRNVQKIHMPNVHMLRSVNAALRRVTRGYTVVMQDDIILTDPQLESKISRLYERLGDRLGVVSFRLGANIAPTPLRERLGLRSLRGMIRELDFIQSPDDSQDYLKVRHESFYPRMAAINGPNVIPWSVLSTVGILDETLAPYGFDDPEYCLRAMKAGFVNGLFPIGFRSEPEWGGTRRSKKFIAEARRIHRRNRICVFQKHGSYIDWLWKTHRVVRDTTPAQSLDALPSYRDLTAAAA